LSDAPQVTIILNRELEISNRPVLALACRF
jgi:hypothetical protein